ncbi:hypothetical protein BKA64DRAFT_95215 [Cadophora sp. MPI-SDFR-AT-0126]|nr:hypothetical protein BKA64DRAFT_95215 [Leotiomycetes sp. MPI-SDFR-AT-0126]
MLGGYQIPVVRTAIGTVADLIKSVVVTWPLESMGYYEYRRRATMKERTIMEVMMECEKIGSTAAMVVGAYGMRAPERIWPSWARCLPLPVLRAVASQSPLEVNASGWWKAFRELPRGALDSSIPLKCLRNQLHRGNLANACSLLHWEDPVTEAIKTDDIPLLIELQVAGEIFIRDESSLCNAISNGRFKSARFLINNDAAKWLLTVDQKSELLKALAEEDRIAASCIVVNAYNVRQLYNTALENIEEFRAKLTTTEVFKDDIRILLDNMKTFGNVFNDALETIMELRTRHFQQRIEGVLAVLLIYRTTKKMSPSKLGEPDLFSADIDRWRSRVEESKLGLFDEVVRLAWEKESHGQDWPELDFEKEFESIDATLRELLNQGLEKTITGLDDVAATQVGLPVQTCGPRLPTPMLSIQTSECGSSREPIWKAAIVLMAGVACAAVLLCTLSMNDPSRVVLQLMLSSTHRELLPWLCRVAEYLELYQSKRTHPDTVPRSFGTNFERLNPRSVRHDFAEAGIR